VKIHHAEASFIEEILIDLCRPASPTIIVIQKTVILCENPSVAKCRGKYIKSLVLAGVMHSYFLKKRQM
jgi:hypothetical protein